MKKLLFSIFLSFCILQIQAQQEQQYSQYIINPFTINPAIAGTEDFIDMQLGYRTQWTGFEGAPKTAYLTGHGTIGKTSHHQYHSKADHKNWHGIGFQYFNDRTGPLHRDAFLLAYAYNMGISKKTRLSVGTYVGFRQMRTDQSYWENIDDQTDNLFSSDLNTGLQPDLQFGAALYNPKYFVYLSAINILGNRMSFELPEDQTQGNDAAYQRHFFLSGGLKLKAGYDVTFTPAVLVKYALQSPASLDLSLKVDHDNKYWYGASFRAIESFNVFAGLNIAQRIDVSYAYEWTVTKISGYNYGTHEIIVGLRIRHPKNVICPSKYW